MKRVAFLLLVTAFLLAGCGLNPKTIVTSVGEAPTPVEEVTTPAPSEAVETPAETTAPTAEPTAVLEGTVSGDLNQLAYVAADGNINLKDLSTGTDAPVTNDATRQQSDAAEQITYYSLAWSSDGTLLAYESQKGTQTENGMDYHFSLWVYNPADGSQREIVADVQTAGYAWRPGTHQLTYALSVQEGYFTSRAEQDKTKATGIWSVDVDAGSAPTEIVPPSAGFTIVAPHWTADGRIVAFNEVFAMEGMGFFASYNMETKKYSRLEKAIGSYNLAPDGSWMVYDTQTYITSGTERIWKSKLDGTGAEQISPVYGEGYTSMPRLSPNGKMVAYLKGVGLPGDPGGDTKELFVQPSEVAKTPQSLGTFDQPTSLEWLPDGSGLILTVGPWNKMELMLVSLSDGTAVKLADGSDAAVR